jgi:hypothetical protein
MTRIVVAFTSGEHRDRLRGPVNLWCPGCSRIAAPVEDVAAPWCSWCASWFCGARCARRHACPARRATYKLLALLVPDLERLGERRWPAA